MREDHDSPSLGTTVRLAVGFDEAVERTRAALKAEGFGVLTEIDVQAAFREKLDREFRPYLILGACNPPLAYRALSADPQIGLLLPCNVTIEAQDDVTTVVRLVNPMSLLAGSAIEAPEEIRAVAIDANARLGRVARALTAGGRS